MSRFILGASALVLVPAAFLFAACDSDASGRVIKVTQTDDGCTPTTIDLKTGEEVTFEVHNESGSDREVEGIDGTNISEVIVPSGRTRNIGYTAPSQESTQKVKCYEPAGTATVIELHVSGSGGTAANPTAAAEEEGEAGSLVTGEAPNATVNVGLVEYRVSPDQASVASGPVKFVAMNTSTSMRHELAVLKVNDDGSFQNTGEVEDIDPGKSGEVVLDLPPGKYQLACLIVPGEAGSTTDHFKEGMHTDFTVE